MPSPENKKARFLLEDEVRTLWEALDQARMTEGMKQALRLILATGQRPGEVIGMHHREIDGAWWTIPAERAKNKREHRVFLSDLAKDLIGTLPAEGFLFPSPRGNGAIQVNALAHAVRRNNYCGITEAWTPHDLRRTCASHLGAAGYADEVIGRILNHTRQGVTARYNRHAYDQEIEVALSAWGRKVARIVAGEKPEKVVTLRRSKR
jgi:integrase